MYTTIMHSALVIDSWSCERCFCSSRPKDRSGVSPVKNEVCLNMVGHCVVIVPHILLSCVFLLFPFPTRVTLETRCNVRQNIWRSVKLSVALVVSWRVFSITIQRRVVSTSLPEKSSTMVIKMLYQVLKDSRKASKSGAETYAKVTCLCDETRYEAVALTEQMTACTVHCSVVRAAGCRSTGPWFSSRRRSWLNFMTWLSNQIIQMINIMSPITTSIRTIARKSVNKISSVYTEQSQKCVKNMKPFKIERGNPLWEGSRVPHSCQARLRQTCLWKVMTVLTKIFYCRNTENELKNYHNKTN